MFVVQVADADGPNRDLVLVTKRLVALDDGGVSTLTVVGPVGDELADPGLGLCRDPALRCPTWRSGSGPVRRVPGGRNRAHRIGSAFRFVIRHAGVTRDDVDSLTVQ